jgi:hypothetical protein
MVTTDMAAIPTITDTIRDTMAGSSSPVGATLTILGAIISGLISVRLE